MGSKVISFRHPTSDLCIVVVAHAGATSISRSVMRAANRAWRNAAMGGTWQSSIVTEWSGPGRTGSDPCKSTVTYRKVG